jgi:hypothetical protein
MFMQLKVDVTGMDSIQRALSSMRSELVDVATSAALNKVGPKARTEMTRAITDEYNIKRDEVTSRLSLRGASANNLRVVLDPFASGKKGRAMNLIHFLEKKVSMAESRRRARNGTLFSRGKNGEMIPVLYFKIKKNEPPKIIPGTFIGNRGRTVFIRIGKSRLAIEAASTVGVPQMFNTKIISQRVLGRINAELPVEFDRAIKYIIEKYKFR